MAVTAQRRRRALVAIVAALIAAGAFYLALEYASKPALPPVGTGAAAPKVQTLQVVVAGTAIAAGSPLSAQNLGIQAVAKANLPLGSPPPFYTSTAQLTQSKSYAAIAIPAGTVLVSSMVTTSPAAAQAPALGASFSLESGQVALALPYSLSAGQAVNGQGTGGYIQAGDQVDILVEIDPVPNPNNVLGNLYWEAENVPVLAVGQKGGGSSPSLIMVELPRQLAAHLSYLEDGKNVTFQYLVVATGDFVAPTPTAQGAPQPVGAANVP